MIKKIGLGILTFLFLSFAVSYLFYSSYRSDRLDSLESNGLIAQTSAGPVEYQLVGDAGPVVLFLHGTPGGHDQAVSIPEYRVLTPSRPGYLRTPLEVGSTPAEQARAYAALLDSLGIDTVVVMGASGGGPSSLAFASTYPQRTSALIAIEAVSQSVAEEDESQAPFFMKSDFLLWATLSLMNNFMGADGIVRMLVPAPANQQLILENPEKLANMESLIWSTWPVSLRDAGMQNDLYQFRNLNLSSDNISAPTLIIHGTEDTNVPFTQSESLASQIPGAELHVIEGADHMMPFSHSEEVSAAIEMFVAAIELD
jgi:pimeloyl-ACP methyl ester carboxylesterase